MKKATIEDVPDWFWSAEIYQKELSLAEWAEELNARIFLMHLSLDEEFNLDSIVKPNEFWNIKFVAFAINGERGDQRQQRQQLLPITELAFDMLDDHYVRIPEYTVNALHSFPYPLLINLNYSKQKLVTDFEKLIDTLIERFDFDTWNQDNLDYFTKKLCSGVKQRLGKQYTGNTAYSESTAKQWRELCVLEYIDLFLWGLLNELDYPESLLASIFWHQDQRRPFKYSAEKNLLNIKRTVRPWVCELLNRRTVARIYASSTEKK